ncbi:hypothetical protein [Pseudomonas syringae]|uniref:hypothetical protein n=1 Tax=Pseudomonas syringae TaxID=317 RepID=UPI000EFEB653|nr:hypothetical protein [Pseudomonas syringae]
MVTIGLKTVTYVELPYSYREFVDACCEKLNVTIATEFWIVFIRDTSYGVFFSFEEASLFMLSQKKKIEQDEDLEPQTDEQRAELVESQMNALQSEKSNSIRAVLDRLDSIRTKTPQKPNNN